MRERRQEGRRGAGEKPGRDASGLGIMLAHDGPQNKIIAVNQFMAVSRFLPTGIVTWV